MKYKSIPASYQMRTTPWVALPALTLTAFAVPHVASAREMRKAPPKIIEARTGERASLVTAPGGYPGTP